MFKRSIEPRVVEALTDTPVVLVTGPRRVGKTTLVKKLGETGRTYITLDNPIVLKAALYDPINFIRGLDLAIIDEIQRAPDLLLTIKMSVDEDYRPGRFLLTGSANVMTLPRVADSLAGRIEMHRMLPLSRSEIEGRKPTFLERLFKGNLENQRNAIVGDDLVRIVLEGGFPEALARNNERRRQEWARSYLESIIAHDLRDIADAEKMAELPRFVHLLAQHSSQLVNYSRIGTEIDVSHKTARRYIGLLEQVFLIATLQPWFTNALKRIVKTPKLHFLDTGLLAEACGMTFDMVKADRKTFGPLLESFVFSETLKLVSATDLQLRTYHFRDHEKREVDLVLERNDGMIAGIEVKASATVSPGDFAGLRALSESRGDRFAFGVVLYDGSDVVSFGKRLAAAPLSCLWN